MYFNKNNVRVYKNAFWLLAVIITITGTKYGCKQPSSKNQALFNHVFKKLDSSLITPPYHYTEADMAYLDNIFQKKHEVRKIDIANKFARKILYYKDVKVDYNTTFVYADSMISLLENHLQDEELRNAYATVLFEKGQIYFKQRKYSEAIRHNTLGKLMLTPGKSNEGSLYGYNYNMANILYAQKKYLQAIPFFQAKYQLAPLVNDDPYIAFMAVQENIDNTGMCYFNAGMPDSAMFYYAATLDYINQNEKKFPNSLPENFDVERSVVYRNQADVLVAKKDFVGAEALYLKSLHGLKNYADKNFTTNVKMLLSELYLKSHQVEKAGTILSDIRSSMDTAEISLAAGIFFKLMAEYYANTGNQPGANAALLHSFNIKDSIEVRDQQLYGTDVVREFENLEQQGFYRVLKKNNELQNGYLLAAGTGAILAALTGVTIWLTMRRKTLFIKDLTSLHTALNNKKNDLNITLGAMEKSHAENSRIIRIVAHDLKIPVSAMHSLVGSLLKREQDLPAKEALEMIETTCADSMLLIGDLLTNKRNITAVSKELVDMGRLIEQCTRLFQIKASEKSQHISVQLDYPVVMLNRQKILRVVSNVVNNAIKFSPEHTEIIITLERKADTVLLSVKDNGIGIPSCLQDKIFTLDPAKSRPGTAGEKSYGLGLSIAKQIIEDHAGNFWFESADGEGSVFFIELPYSVN